MKTFLLGIITAFTIATANLIPMAATAAIPAPHYLIAADCNGVQTSIDYGCTSAAGGPIYAFIRAIIAFLGGAVGLVVILMLIIGGIRYITSAGNPALVKSAKQSIYNALIGLALFLTMLAILNFLLPGGIIK